MVEALSAGAVHVNGENLFLNEPAERIVGCSRFEIGTLTLWFEKLHPEDPQAARTAYEADRDSGFRKPRLATVTRLDGGRRVVELVSFRDQSDEVWLLHDVTAERKAEENLRRADKLEGLGRLAGGIAHDFNNLLTVMLGFAEMAQNTCRKAGKPDAHLDHVLQAGAKAKALTRQLVAFSKRQIVEPRIVDLNRLTFQLDGMLRRLLGEDIELALVPETGLWPVRADPGGLEQVLINLTVNARDAMPHGGRLTITTRNASLSEALEDAGSELPPGDYAVLSVADNGIGMSAETRARLFEPFYTTKGIDGTGLGLATAYGIIGQSGGAITVESEPGKGSLFTIYLPRTEGTPDPVPTPPPPPRPGTETILVVEDYELVRDLAVRVLESHGYTVHAARSGDDAILLSNTFIGQFDLLITDVHMPNMSGPELATRLRIERPNLKVLFVSGFTEDLVLRPSTKEGDDEELDEPAFLAKPFTPDALARAVRTLLDRKAKEKDELAN